MVYSTFAAYFEFIILFLVNLMQQSPSTGPGSIKQSLSAPFAQVRYRWVIVVLMCVSLILNGLANNAIIPIQSKMSKIYMVSEGVVSSPIIISFLIFIAVNFPANHIIDTRGLRVSFLIGLTLYSLGLFTFCLVNHGYGWVIIGTIIVSFGQPFILNCPAKIATFWFFPKNRTLATAIMVGFNIFGSGLGFVIPTLVVKEQSTGDVAKSQILRLYAGYAITCCAVLIANVILMKAKPSIAPSGGAEAQKLTFKESVQLVKKDKNLWRFFIGYFLLYGTFIAFASCSNFLVKPFGYTDFEISISAVFLIICGTIGSIVFSIYIKKTNNYKLALRISTFMTCIMMTLLAFCLAFVNNKVIMVMVFASLGFFLTPIVPLSYDLGCQLSFPIGEAQVTGLLNTGALMMAFIGSFSITAIFGFSSTRQSMSGILTLLFWIIGGTVLYSMINYHLKRKEFEKGQKKQSTDTSQYTNQNGIEMTEESSKVEEETTDRNTDKKEYADLVEESIL